MNPAILIEHFLPAALIVLTFFFSMRCLFAHDLRLEAWRTPVKHRIYVDHATFKWCVKSLGMVFLLAFFTVTNRVIMGMIQ